jgi:hypothetical protein
MVHILMIIATLILGLGTVATAQESGTTPKTYADVMRDCGSQWRSSEARKAVPKGEGRMAWNNFRRDCVKASGYVAKRSRG